MKKILNFLKDKPFFKQLFYHVHDMLKDELCPNSFIAIETNGFLLGTYRKNGYRMWRKLIEGDFETKEIEQVKSFDFDYFIDIGAHIGYYSLSIATTKKCKVLAFEPNTANYQSLIKNLDINNIDYVAKNVGLSDVSEKVHLYGDDAWGSMNKLTFNNFPSKSSIVALEKLDDYISYIPKNAKVFIKIDVEGNEYKLLQGAIDFIKQTNPVGMLIEISPVWSSGNNPNYGKTISLIKSLGFKIKEISVGSYIATANYI